MFPSAVWPILKDTKVVGIALIESSSLTVSKTSTSSGPRDHTQCKTTIVVLQVHESSHCKITVIVLQG